MRRGLGGSRGGSCGGSAFRFFGLVRFTAQSQVRFMLRSEASATLEALNERSPPMDKQRLAVTAALVLGVGDEPQDGAAMRRGDRFQRSLHGAI